MEELSAFEFAQMHRDRMVVLLPLGSQEGQGPHAPMGDFRIAERVVSEAAERSGALCAPVLPFGYAEFFRGIPGGIQLRASTFHNVLTDILTALLDQGIERIIICNGHTTNAALIADVTQQIRRKRDVTIPAINLWRVMPESVWRALHGDNLHAARGHGADPLTSLYLHYMPEFVNMDRAAPAVHEGRIFGMAMRPELLSTSFEGGTIDWPLDVADMVDHAMVSGDASLSRADIGQAIAEWTVQWLARFVDHFRNCDPRDPFGSGGAPQFDC